MKTKKKEKQVLFAYLVIKPRVTSLPNPSMQQALGVLRLNSVAGAALSPNVHRTHQGEQGTDLSVYG